MTSPVSLARVACLFLPLWSASNLTAQDAHYWTVQYGPRASLLGGAVIGAVSDVSAAFYNPGGLALADSLGFAFSISVLEHRSTTAEEGVVGSDDVSSDRTGMAPSMLGGAIRGAPSAKHRFAYSLITRQRSRFSTSELVIESTPVFETLGSYLRVEQAATERWGGVSWAYRVGPSVGVGATAFVSSRSDARFLRVSVAGSESGEGVVSTRRRDFSYDQYALVGKFGVLFERPTYGLGVTMTMPSIRIWGSGTIFYSDIDVRDETGGPPPVLAAADQEDLRASYRHPFSIGAGGRLAFGTLQIYGSAEWFDGVDRYEVLGTRPFNGQSPGGPLSFRVEDERESVLNWALATEQRLSPRVTAYVSYATDYSSNSEDPGVGNLAFASWDTRQVSLGADLRIGGRSLTLGGAYGWGDSLGRRFVALQEDVGMGGLLPPVEPTRLEYRVFRLILGFEF